jgi:hypothetical protein
MTLSRRLDWPDVDDFLLGCVAYPAKGQGDKSNDDQGNPYDSHRKGA